MKYLISLLMLTACVPRPTEDIGKIEIVTEFTCLKKESQTNPGFSTSGQFIVTTSESCLIAKCMRKTYILGKYYGLYAIVKKEILDDSICIEEETK